MTTSSGRSPRLARALLAWLLSSGHAADVLGDLEEGFHRRVEEAGVGQAVRWYWWQTVQLAARPSLWRRVVPAAGREGMMTMGQDLRHAFRLLVRYPLFSGVVVLTLSVGIGSTTAIFSAIDRLLLRTPDIEEPDRVYEIYGTRDGESVGAFQGFLPVSYPNFEDVREGTKSLDGLYAVTQWSMSMSAPDGEPERVQAMFTSADYFRILGVPMSLGRAFLPEEDVGDGAHPVVVLTHAYWTRRFGADAAVLGRGVTLNGRGYEIVGVAREDFTGTSNTFTPDLFVPVTMMSDIPGWGPLRDNRGVRMFVLGGRLGDGVTEAEARAELGAFAVRLAEAHPQVNDGYGFRLVPLAEAGVLPSMRATFVQGGALMMGAVGLVLLIGCINVATLLLGRAMGRRREMAVRKSLGAGELRLARQLMTESAVLFGLGAIAGLLVAAVAHRLLWSLRPPNLTLGEVEFALDLRVAGFALVVTAASALIFGLVPAWRATRTEPVTDLRGSGGVGGKGSTIARGGLVVAQVALSLIALVGAGLFMRSLAEARRIDPGFVAEGLGMLSMDPGAQGYGADELRGLYERVVEEALAAPGIAAAAVGELRPLSFGPLRGVRPEGGPAGDDPEDNTLVRTNAVSPGYLETLGIPLLRGRGIDPGDRAGGPPVVVINERLAEMFWPGADPIGRRLLFSLEDEWAEVVGVVRTGRYNGLGEDPQPAMYRAAAQTPPASATLYIRSRGATGAALAAARRRVQALDPDMPLFDIEPGTALVENALWGRRVGAILLTAFGLVGLALAALGIYGVLATAVRERTHEMGLRMALGADSGRVLRSVLGRAMALVGLGVALGAAGALLLARTVSGLLFGVSAADPATFVLVSLALLLTAALAGYLPARRATKVDPVQALRRE